MPKTHPEIQLSADHTPQHPLHPLSPEIVLLVLSFLPPRDTCAFALVSKECYLYTTDDSLWRHHITTLVHSSQDEFFYRLRRFGQLLIEHNASRSPPQHPQHGRVTRGALLSSAKTAYFVLTYLGRKQQGIANDESADEVQGYLNSFLAEWLKGRSKLNRVEVPHHLQSE